ncbi:MAG: hypothetical protein HC821_04625 [Lewinella sp.]|nr:hypothetical protein [Lewinella sp.]
MSAHPSLSQSEAESMVAYILSLNDRSRLPPQGQLLLPLPSTPGVFVLAASYKDGGSPSAPALTGSQVLVLRPPRLEAETAADFLFRAHIPQGGEHHAFKVVTFRPGGYLALHDLDLRSLRQLSVGLHPYTDGALELRLGGPQGLLLGRQNLKANYDWFAIEQLNFKLPVSVDTLGRQSLFLQWLGPEGRTSDDMGHHRPSDCGWMDWLEFGR